MQQKLREGLAEAIIFEQPNRLSRDSIDGQVLIFGWMKDSIEIHITTIGYIDGSPARMMQLSFGQTMAHAEVIEMARKTKRGKDLKVSKQGKMILAGLTPYGYKKIGLLHQAKLEFDKPRSKVVQDIFEYYVNERLSLNAITEHLNEFNAPLPNSRKTQAKKWHRSTVKRILNNPIYKGVYAYGKTRNIKNHDWIQRGKNTRSPKDEWLYLNVPDLALVNEQIWEIAQVRLQENRTLAHRNKRNRRREYLLAGHIVCAHCQYNFVSTTTTHNNKEYQYYRHRIDGLTDCNCNNKHFKINELDDIVWGWLYNLLTDEENQNASAYTSRIHISRSCWNHSCERIPISKNDTDWGRVGEQCIKK